MKKFENLRFSIHTLLHFKIKKIKVIGTNEHTLVQKIKTRIPSRIFLFLKFILRRNEVKQESLWDKPLTEISMNKGHKVLIIAELSIPQCTKYRVNQKVEMLSYLGYNSAVVSWTDLHEARNLLQLCGMVIFYRVPAHDVVKSLIKESNRLGISTFFDVDDIVFDKALLKQNINIQNLPKKIQKELFSGADLYKTALSLSQYSMSSTSALGKHMGEHCKGRNYLIPNCLDQELLKYVSTQSNHINHSSDTITIVYGSGTSTHDIDFQEVADALILLLKKYKNLQFVIHGTLTLPDTFANYKSQIKVIPFMKANEYYSALQTYDINIAPLEKSIFNDAKSNIKYLEASIFRIPTVASCAKEYNTSIIHGIDGFLAKDTQSWVTSLEQLILNASLRQKIGENAYTKVLDEYKIEAIAKNYMLPILENHLYKNDPTVTNVLMANVLYKPISFGGATIVIEELSKLISKKEDHEVTIFTGFFCFDYDLPREYDIVRYEVNNVPVILMRFPEPMSQKLEYYNETMEKVFDTILKSIQPNIVHFHSIQQLSASITKPCITNHIPYIITLHDMWWLCEKQFMIMPDNTYCHQKKIDTNFCITQCTNDAKKTKERTSYLTPILHDASLLLAPSLFQAQMYLDNGYNQEKIKVNKNGILFPSETYKHTPSNTVRFAYLGGNAVHKGYNHIKDIFESINTQNYELILVDLHKKLGHDSIFKSDWDIQGTLTISEGYDYSQEGLDEFFKSIDVLLFPSQWKESFGLTIREALVRDVWVITTDSGGVVEDIVEGENGNIVSMHDSASLKEKIKLAIQQPDFFKTYNNPYKKKIRSYKQQANELIEYYHTVLEKK